MNKDTYEEMSVTILRMTDRAVHVDAGDKEGWIPKSLFDPDETDFDDFGEGLITEIHVARWFLEKEGWV